MKKYLKGHHFELGKGPTAVASYETISKLAHGSSGTHLSRYQAVSQDTKNDHRASHFKMGWESRPLTGVVSTTNSNLGMKKPTPFKNKTIETNGQISALHPKFMGMRSGGNMSSQTAMA